MERVRRTFELREDLLKSAYELVPKHKKRDVIELSLEEFIASRRQKDLTDLRGKISFHENYENGYKAMRDGKYQDIEGVVTE